MTSRRTSASEQSAPGRAIGTDHRPKRAAVLAGDEKPDGVPCFRGLPEQGIGALPVPGLFLNPGYFDHGAGVAGIGS